MNIKGMMEQAQRLQAKMAEAQEKLDQIFVEGRAGGGLVKVKMSAKGVLSSIEIDPSLFKDEDKTVLEDLIVAACADGRQKADAAAQEEMEKATMGMNLPKGFL